MRKLACTSALLLLLLPRVSTAAPVFVYDGGLGTWSDVNKTSVAGPPDSLMCWAAAASDSLAWAGWRGWDNATMSYIDTADSIYAQFVSQWPNSVGAATYAYEWWMTNRTESIIEDPPGSGISAKTFPSAGLDFYPGVPVMQGVSVTAFTSDVMWGLNQYVPDDRAIVASIRVPSGPGTVGPYSHAVSVWGWDPAASLIYLTDSDDGLSALRTYSFYQSGGSVFIQGYSNLYTSATNAQITQLTRLNRNDAGLEPNHGPVAPEPALLVLFGAGVAAVFRRRAQGA